VLWHVLPGRACATRHVLWGSLSTWSTKVFRGTAMSLAQRTTRQCSDKLFCVVVNRRRKNEVSPIPSHWGALQPRQASLAIHCNSVVMLCLAPFSLGTASAAGLLLRGSVICLRYHKQRWDCHLHCGGGHAARGCVVAVAPGMDRGRPDGELGLGTSFCQLGVCNRDGATRCVQSVMSWLAVLRALVQFGYVRLRGCDGYSV
jgi:hypothetical protein